MMPREENIQKMSVAIEVNGTLHRHEVEPRLLLVHFLRDVLGLTGTHIGCDTSQCGACTIEMGDCAIKSCTMFAVQANGMSIRTIEGVAASENMDPIQKAFCDCHALQCGFCTPGMIMTARQILRRDPNPNEEMVRHQLDGNLCRCTGYHNIVKAILRAAKKSSLTQG